MGLSTFFHVVCYLAGSIDCVLTGQSIHKGHGTAAAEAGSHLAHISGLEVSALLTAILCVVVLCRWLRPSK